MVYELIKFCVVGGSGTLVDFGTTWLLKEKAHLNRYVANSCGFILAASTNYILNRLWTFHSQNPEITKEYFLFIGISLLGLLLNNCFLWLFSEKISLPLLSNHGSKLRFYSSKLIAIGLVTVWNFFMNYYITFK